MKIKNVWDAAHPLEKDRITFGQACARFGANHVRRAMQAGKVYLALVVNVKGAAFDPRNATADSVLVANGVGI